MKNKNYWGSILIIPFLISMLSIRRMQPTVKASDFQPISEGEIIGISITSQGNAIIVSLVNRAVYYYARVAYHEPLGWSTVEIMLPDNPKAVSVMGCGHLIDIVASIDETIYVSEVEIPGSLSCGNMIDSIFIPMVDK